jgi:uncharacterized protein
VSPSIPVWKFALLGLLAGVLSGLFGVGGGFIIVPLLIKLGIETKRAAATSLAAVIPIAIAAVVPYALHHKVHGLIAAILVVGGFAGARLGTALLPRIPESYLQFGFAALLTLAALKLAFTVADGFLEPLTVRVEFGLVALGFITGVLSGLLGIGGGFVMVPGMLLVASMPGALAKGTSLAAVIPTALYGSWRNRSVDMIDVGPAWRIGLCGAATSSLSARFAVGLNPRLANGGFAVLLFGLAAYMWRTARNNKSESLA